MIKKSKKILIVEDEVLIVLSLKAELKTYGFEIVGDAATGIGAIDKWFETQPDIVLMDLQLAGGMSGLEAAGIIRETSNVPIVFMTGYSDSVIMKTVKSFNLSAFLVKPLDSKKLIDSINHMLPD